MTYLKTGAVATALVGLLGVVLSAGKPPRSTSTAATATFRCTADASNSSDPCGGTDRVQDDGAPYVGGSISSTGMYLVRFTPTSNERLDLIFGQTIAGSRSCESIGNCNPDGPLQNLDGSDRPLGLTDFELRVKPLHQVSGVWEDLPNGLFAMTCGAPYEGLVHYTFWLPGGDGHWGLNFNPKAYPDTTGVTLTRTGNTTWTATAESFDVTELLSWSHSGITKRNGPSREGRFNMPFRVTIEATGSLPSGAVTCTP